MLLALRSQWGLIYKQSINEKPSNLMKYWERKLKDLWSVTGEKTS